MKTLALTTLLFALAGLSADSVDFAVLSDFDYTEGMELPSTVTKYDEESLEVAGFMRREIPGEGEVETFMLINDACGCTGEPKLNEVIFCTMPEDETTKIKSGIVTVTGTLYVGEEKEDGVVWAIYTMDVDTVK